MTHHDRVSGLPKRRKRDPKGTRDRLVRAALELFTTRGYHGSTTPQIAARAGIAEGTIYRHFESKSHLLNEIYRAGIRLLAATLRQEPAGLSCQGRLRRLASEWRVLASQNPPLVKFIFSTDLEQLLDHKSRDARRSFRFELEKVIAAGKSAGEIRAGSVELWTELWLRLITLVLERTATDDWPLDHPAADQVLDGAWEAIRRPLR
jgi:AcrR family transcriptional regulator